MFRHCLPGQLTSAAVGFGVDQRCEGRVTAQPVQAAAASRPDAADWDAQAGADLRVRCRRVLGEQGDQLLVARGQLQELLVRWPRTFTGC